MNDSESLETFEARRQKNLAKGINGNGMGMPIGVQAKLAGWNSPRSTDGTKGGPNQSGGALSHDATLAGWGTPAAQNAKHTSLSASEQKRDPNVLHNQVHLAGWQTPTVPPPHDNEDSAGQDFPSQNQNHIGRQAGASIAETDAGEGFRLNPAFSLWLIAGDSVTPELIETCPRGLVPSKRRAMRSSSNSRPNSSEP
jgi:hypothetical protein